jgi:hypothetical protein
MTTWWVLYISITCCDGAELKPPSPMFYARTIEDCREAVSWVERDAHVAEWFCREELSPDE